MASSFWDKDVQLASRILMQPIVYNDLQITFIEFIGASHAADWKTTIHRHPWYEFNYVSQGRVYTRIENTEFLVEPGHIFLIPPGVMHSHRHCDYTGDDGFCVRWKFEKIEWPDSVGVHRVADDLIAGFSHYRPLSITFAADQLLCRIADVSGYELEAAFIQWLMQIYRILHPELDKGSGRQAIDRPRNVVQQVLLYLEEYYATDIDVRELADSLAYSYRHLARLFKEKTGSTIIEKLNGIRLAKAIDLLVNTDRPINLIGCDVGFNTETYFSTIFAAYTELSPSAYRNRFGRR